MKVLIVSAGYFVLRFVLSLHFVLVLVEVLILGTVFCFWFLVLVFWYRISTYIILFSCCFGVVIWYLIMLPVQWVLVGVCIT